jgi:acetyl esterase/lipase
MDAPITRPPYDPAVQAALAEMASMLPSSITPEMIGTLRAAPMDLPDPTPGFDLERREVKVSGYERAQLDATVLSRPGHSGHGPGIFHIHGGGMILGDRLNASCSVSGLPRWVLEHDAVVVTVEYRLAPEFPDPYPVEDCYAALVWTAQHAEELGIDRSRLLITGPSAGGGLAAGTALLARDRKGPALHGQMLIYPMLDDRNDTVSAQQFEGIGVWDRTSNFTGWGALLGNRRGTSEVSIYAAPARATDLSGLPPAYIEVASAEVFRDEDVAYASRLWADGGVAELHVWPGGTHGFDLIVPDAGISQQARAARDAWYSRLLEA